jgi:hypothetical protein
MLLSIAPSATFACSPENLALGTLDLRGLPADLKHGSVHSQDEDCSEQHGILLLIDTLSQKWLLYSTLLYNMNSAHSGPMSLVPCCDAFRQSPATIYTATMLICQCSWIQVWNISPLSHDHFHQPHYLCWNCMAMLTTQS